MTTSARPLAKTILTLRFLQKGSFPGAIRIAGSVILMDYVVGLSDQSPRYQADACLSG